MNTYQEFRKAIEDSLLVVATVILYSGEVRVRFGWVGNLTQSHVTIYDLGKLDGQGHWRTTPLELVHDVKLQKPPKPYALMWERMLKANG